MGFDLEKLIVELYDVQAVKFGSFTLKSGIESPIYFDLRVIVSYPQLMTEVSEILWQVVEEAGCKYDSVCGVPYTALPLATIIASHHNKPMLIRRKEGKDYGTKKMIEGHFKAGENCLIVEDVVTSGSSVFETAQVLKKEGIQVSDAVVLLNREQGGSNMLSSQNIKLHSVLTVSKMVQVLEERGKIDKATVESIKKFIADNNFQTIGNPQKRKAEEYNEQEKAKRSKTVMKYSERKELCTHPLSKKLFDIMEKKKTNLSLSVDVTSSEKLLKLADQIGPHICMLKTHVDILEDFTPSITQDLSNLAEKHNFLIFEDRKFADIGNTVQHQYKGGVYKINDWAHIINAHGVPGSGIVKGLREVGKSLNRGCLMIAQMSSEGNLARNEYTKACVQMAEEEKDFVIGFICTSQVSSDPTFIHMTPGVQLSPGGDSLGQQYLTPKEVISKRSSDVIIVGRGILNAENPVEEAKRYQEEGYAAYLSLFS